MAVLPILPLVRPAVLAGQLNGRLPASILTVVPGLASGPQVRLVGPAARAWRALAAAALAAEHTLKATSSVDSYRPYDVQERIFRARYTTTPLAGRPSRVWNGVRWWQRPNTAAAAVPGTSNHGWALAVDTGEESDGDAGCESLDQGTLEWLLKNAARFGWSWELQSEPWHLRYVPGDTIPAAVLAYEGGAPNPEPTPPEDDDMTPAEFVALLQTDPSTYQALAKVARDVLNEGAVPGSDGTWSHSNKLAMDTIRLNNIALSALLGRTDPDDTGLDVQALAEALALHIGVDMARTLGEALVRGAAPIPPTDGGT